MHSDDHDPNAVAFYDFETRKARKEHKCIECEEIIPVGTSYIHYVMRCDDKFSAWNVCEECENDWLRLIDVFYITGIQDSPRSYGRIREAIQDAVDIGCLDENDPLVEKWVPGIMEVAVVP